MMRFLFFRAVCLIGFAGLCLDASGGEIAGLRSQLVPTIDPDVTLNFSNDFLGRGGSLDDFRTAQVIISAKVAEKWFVLFDHSTLTLEESQQYARDARVDQLTGSLGYRFVNRETGNQITRITAGSGFRSAGNFSGEQLQNGFHRIVDSTVKNLPYVSTSTTDLTLWFDADYYNRFHTSGGEGFFSGWESGYWIRASSLVTSDSQWDSALGAYAVTSNGLFDVWLGLRRDWRSGYDQDIVQRATASAEDDIAAVVGLRWGALIIETVQQFNNRASYGQLRVIADGRQPFPGIDSVPRFNVEFGFILPDVQVQLAGKIRSNVLVTARSLWRESIFIETRFGEPQYEDNASLYIRTRQLSVGMEWERSLPDGLNWISAYGALGIGYRYEKLLGDQLLDGEESDSAGRTTATLNTGLRFAAADLGAGWRYRLQFGVTGWLPSSKSEVLFLDQPFQLHKPGFALILGMTFDYE